MCAKLRLASRGADRSWSCWPPRPPRGNSSSARANPDGKMATASRPGSAGKIEIESADDFVLTSSTNITSATFTGLLPTSASLSDIVDVRIEIYRVFPNDSDVGRTSGPPTFSTPQVPTRVNSPSDVEFDDRSASAHTLTFTPGIVSPSFTAANSVLNGIHPLPGINTGGDGPVTGQEVQFNVLFSTPFSLPADHYFFVPQVQLIERRFLLALGAQADRPAGDAVPGWLHRPPRMDSQRKPGTGLAAGRDGHRRREPRADVQRGLLAGGPDRSRAHHQPDDAGPGSGRRVRRRPGATTQPSRPALNGLRVGQED